MEELNDEQIQKWLEAGRPVSGEAMPPFGEDDLKLYEQVFSELEKEPVVRLSYGFSANVVRRVQLQKQRAGDRLFYLLIGGLVVVGLAGAGLAFRMLDQEATAYFVLLLIRYKWLMIFSLSLFITFQVLDYKLLGRHKLPASKRLAS